MFTIVLLNCAKRLPPNSGLKEFEGSSLVDVDTCSSIIVEIGIRGGCLPNIRSIRLSTFDPT